MILFFGLPRAVRFGSVGVIDVQLLSPFRWLFPSHSVFEYLLQQVYAKLLSYQYFAVIVLCRILLIFQAILKFTNHCLTNDRIQTRSENAKIAKFSIGKLIVLFEIRFFFSTFKTFK